MHCVYNIGGREAAPGGAERAGATQEAEGSRRIRAVRHLVAIATYPLFLSLTLYYTANLQSLHIFYSSLLLHTCNRYRNSILSLSLSLVACKTLILLSVSISIPL